MRIAALNDIPRDFWAAENYRRGFLGLTIQACCSYKYLQNFSRHRGIATVFSLPFSAINASEYSNETFF